MTRSVQWLSEAHALKCELAEEVLLSSGRLRLKVTGWSMLPSIWPGDVLLIERAEAEEISKGDVVLCRYDRRFVVHRIVKNFGPELNTPMLTRGDAMPACDSPVYERDLLGKVSLILRDGVSVLPRRYLSPAESAVAVLVTRSTIAAQIVVRLHDFLAQGKFESQKFNHRAASCQS